MRTHPILFSFLLSIVTASALVAAEKPKVSKGKLTAIQGIGEATEKKLGEAGITSTEDLLEKGATRKGREEIVAKSGLGAALVLKFVNYADLFRIKGVAGQNAELLEAAGVDSVAELATRNPANLTAKLKEVNDAKKLSGKAPAESLVAGWIEAAKTLPKKVAH
jgi:predicted flap endonuclease-1-like 5' DNA nuclease